ncbi:MAG TPA: energy transducer TonB [Thermoanaerobaculia bacterium]|nr:energy transducer TonB [Thermoanaerobaculia bacterium]
MAGVALLGAALAGRTVRADTRPPVDIPALREAQAQDAAVAAIDGQIQRGEWEPARAAAAELLARSKSVRLNALQRALVRLALLEAQLGRGDDAAWHWQALQALGGAELAAPLLPRFGGEAAKLAAQAAGAADEVPPGVEREGTAGLVAPRRLAGDVPQGNGGCVAARGPLWARLRAVVDTRGRLTQPAITGPSVCFSFEVLKATREWRFDPAHRGGEPVAATYSETIHPPGTRAVDVLAAGVPGLAPLPSLFADGKLAATKADLERRWNAALDAGSPSRPLTVSLLALRALALASSDSADDQRRATCLWEAAQGEEPSLYDIDLASLGEGGQRLAPHRFGEVRSLPALSPAPGERMERPEVLRETRRRPRPRFPPSAYAADRVYVEAIVDAEGAVREPVLFDRRDGMRGLDLEALDAICSWRFRPATIAGRPVQVSYVITLSVAQGSATR